MRVVNEPDIDAFDAEQFDPYLGYLSIRGGQAGKTRTVKLCELFLGSLRVHRIAHWSLTLRRGGGVYRP